MLLNLGQITTQAGALAVALQIERDDMEARVQKMMGRRLVRAVRAVAVKTVYEDYNALGAAEQSVPAGSVSGEETYCQLAQRRTCCLLTASRWQHEGARTARVSAQGEHDEMCLCS